MKKSAKTTCFTRLPLLLLAALLPLLSLLWGGQLLAQSAANEPALLVLQQRPDPDLPGVPTYTLTVVGLFEDGDQFLEVNDLAVTADPASGVKIITTSVATNQPFSITLLVDTSGSMAQHLTATKTLLRSVVNTAPAHGRFSIVSFNGQINQAGFQPFTSDKTELRAAIAALAPEDGPTCLHDAAYTAVQSLAQQPQNSRRGVILFSDGADEVTRGQPGQCSARAQFDEALNLAAAQPVPIPVHVVQFPYVGAALETAVPTLPLSNTLQSGLMLSMTGIAETEQQLRRIVHSFARQWQAAIDLYTPAGTYTLTLQPALNFGAPGSTFSLPYTAAHDHLPPALNEALRIQNLVYNEAQKQFEFDLTLCANGDVNPYCHLPRIQALDVLVEDLFTNETVDVRSIPVSFDGATLGLSETIPVTIAAALQNEHHHLLRVSARNDVTDARLHPFTEATFTYLPQLTVRVTQATLAGGFTLQPQLTVVLEAARSGPDIAPRQPDALTVGGYLVYTAPGGRSEVYPLPPQQHPVSSPVTATFAVPGGWAGYDLYLVVRDGADGLAARQTFAARTPGVTDLEAVRSIRPQPANAWASAMLFSRRVLDQPAQALAYFLLFFLLLALVALAAWLARRVFALPPREEAPRQQPALDPGLYLTVEATPDAEMRRQTFPAITSFPFTIGRRADNALALAQDEMVAEKHAEINEHNGVYTITHLSDDHSTFINDDEIIAHAPIPFRPDNGNGRGDRIRIGPQTRLAFREVHENGSAEK